MKTADRTLELIENTLELYAPPDRVWRAITDPRELERWFPDDGAAMEPLAGGAGWLGWESHGRFELRVEVFEPPTRLAWRWSREPGTPIDEGQSTLVEWTLEPRAGGGTVLRVVETGFVAPEHREGNVEGWAHELGELRAYLGAT